MKKSDSKCFTMGKAVHELFIVNKIWQGNTMIEASVERLNGLCVGISKEATLQHQNQTPGHTETFDRERTALEEHLFMMGTRLGVYAQITNNSVLALQVHFSRSELASLMLNRLLIVAKSVAGVVGTYMKDLEPYKITQGDVDKLQTLTDKTEELAAFRDTIRSGHTENTAQLTKLISSLRKELKLMDKLVIAFINDKTFLNTYFITRKIHDVRGKSNPKK